MNKQRQASKETSLDTNVLVTPTDLCVCVHLCVDENMLV